MIITINLLPTAQKSKKYEKKTKEIVSTLCFFILATVIGASILLFTHKTNVQSKLDSANQLLTKENNNLNKYKKSRESIEQISSTISYIDLLANKGMKWEKFLGQFGQVVPEQVQITSLRVSTIPASTIEISGNASSRREVITLLEKIRDTKYFKDPELKSLDKSNTEENTTSFSFSILAQIVLEKI